MDRTNEPIYKSTKKTAHDSGASLYLVRKLIQAGEIPFIVSGNSGCRNGEVVGLRWDAIDFTSGEVKIKLNAQYATGRGVYLSTTKNRKNRTITLNAPVLAIIKSMAAGTG
jgi:integrase